jgi:hypothetical protein
MVDGIGIPDPGAEVPWPSAEPDPQNAEANLARDLAEILERDFLARGREGGVIIDRSTTVGVVCEGMHIFWKKHPDVFLKLRVVKASIKILFREQR